MSKHSASRQDTALHVSRVSIFWNVLLSAGKLAAGIFAHSGAMISDAIHSASDVFSTVIVMVGVRIAARDSDRDHPYGHERFECVAANLLAVVLFLAGLAIGKDGLDKILSSGSAPLAIPGIAALAAAVVSIIVKEILYRYTRRAADRIHSGALLADAWHHRSDALSSVGSFIGILGARLGFPVLDPVASLVICLLIMKAAVDIYVDAINKMTDRACDDDTIRVISETVTGQDGVLAIDALQTRLFGDRIYVDMEISVDGARTLYDAHAVAERVHDAIEDVLPDVKHCNVHVNPGHR